jgi:hypothetical protein
MGPYSHTVVGYSRSQSCEPSERPGYRLLVWAHPPPAHTLPRRSLALAALLAVLFLDTRKAIARAIGDLRAVLGFQQRSVTQVLCLPALVWSPPGMGQTMRTGPTTYMLNSPC